MGAVTPAGSSAELLLLEGASAAQANQRLLSSQVLLPFTTSQRKTVHEMDMEQIWKLCGFMASSFSQEVRSQELSSQPISPSLHPRAACSSGVPARQAWAQPGALSMFVPRSKGLHPSFCSGLPHPDHILTQFDMSSLSFPFLP